MALNAKTDPTYVPKRINGKFAPGYSGNPGGSLEATRRSFNKDFLLALAADFKQHGASAIAKVRKQQPAAYMKICALLVPREMRVEHTGGVKSMTDEELERGIAAVQVMLAARDGQPGQDDRGRARARWRSRPHRQGASMERGSRLPPCVPDEQGESE